MKPRNYWNTTTSKPKSQWVSKLPDHAKVVVLGAGGAGLLTAVTLALGGAEDVTVVEAGIPAWRGARKGIGAATLFTKQLDAMHKLGFHVRDIFKYLRMSIVGMKNNLEFINRYSNVVNNDDWCHPVQYGGFHLAQTDEQEEQVKQWVKYLEFCNINATAMKPEQISKLTSLNVERDGVFVPNEFMLNPAQYFNGVVQACHRLGVDIHSGFLAEEVYQDGRWWILADAEKNFIKCDKLIVCTGCINALPEIPELMDFVTPRRVCFGATPEVATMRLPPYNISTMDGAQVSRRYDNRIIMALDDNDKYTGDYKSPRPSSIRTALENTQTLYPIVSDVEKQFEYVWAKNIMQTRDSLPIVCELEDYKNLFVNVGYGIDSLGWQHIGAAIIKELVLGSKTTPGVQLFSLERAKTSEGF